MVPDIITCYVPVPSRFAATYSNTTGITLNWSTVGHLPDQDSCENVQISVQVSFYSSYDAYNSLQDHADDTIFFPPISSDETSFRLAASEVRLDHYYVFDVEVRYRTHTLSRSTIVKSSQLFYFGIQGKAHSWPLQPYWSSIFLFNLVNIQKKQLVTSVKLNPSHYVPPLGVRPLHKVLKIRFIH